MPDVDQVEVYLAEKAGLPMERVSRIYRAGIPWPLVRTHLDRETKLYAKTFQVSLEKACAVVDEWSKMEESRLKELLAAVQTAEDGTPDFFEKLRALCSFPAIREMLDHSMQISILTREDWGAVVALHFALHSYSMENPDWDPPEQDPRIRPS